MQLHPIIQVAGSIAISGFELADAMWPRGYIKPDNAEITCHEGQQKIIISRVRTDGSDTQPISSKQTFLKPPSGGFCVSKSPYSVGFCGLPVPKPLHRLPRIFDLLRVFWPFLLKTSRLLQNDLQVVMCLIIKDLIVRTFFEFFSITWLPNRQKNSALVVVFPASRIPVI
jgi:hypothetical protein